MTSSLSFSTCPNDRRLRTQLLDAAVTFRSRAQRYGINDGERRQWQRHMRAEALNWCQLGHPGALGTRSA